MSIPKSHRLARVAAVGLALLGARALPAQLADILIRGGTLVDGTGSAPRRADVAIRGDRITFVGDAVARGVTAATTIEAAGLTVGPGYIDPHTHTLGDLRSEQRDRRLNAAYLMQGVTTVVTGNDGGGPSAIAEALGRFRSEGIGTNAALFVGFGTVRQAVLGPSSAAPNAAQLRRMADLVDAGMREGALGLSTGLYYAPQSYATTEEVIELSRVAARHGGIYDSHMRDESSYSIGLLGSIRETLRIGVEAGLPVHISHIKALGVDVWGRSDSVIAMIRAARAHGQQVTANQYPYTASGSSVGASLLPRWAEAGGRDSLRLRAADPATRVRLVTDMTENLRRRGGAGALLITATRQRELSGRTLEALAAARGTDAVTTAIEIILAGDASVASFNMNEHDIAAFMREDFVFTGSDGSDGHPRKYGTYPRKVREYVLGQRVLPLEAMVRRSAGDVADALGIEQRGRVIEGAYADVIVFDLGQVRDRATYSDAQLLAEGMRHVLVNGQFAVRDGALTGQLPGRGLGRKGRP